MFMMLFLTTSLVVSAQTSYRLKAYKFSCKAAYNGTWSDWTEWDNCDILISLNLETSRIKIFSEEIQDYAILKVSEKTDFDDNGKSIIMECMDKNGLVCSAKLRAQYHPKVLQLYIEYNDAILVYCVETF